MAKLEGQSIASSYEQLLHVDRDGGGNGATHVAVKDGKNDNTFALTLATDAVMITSTNRLEFGDDGTYIHQSADGVLDLVSDTEIEINATTIDINGAAEISGKLGIGGTASVDELEVFNTVSDTSSQLALTTQSSSGNTSTFILRSNRNDTVGSHTVVTNGQFLGQILFQGSDGTDYEDAARIFATVDGSPAGDATDMPGALNFATTADGSDSMTTHMKIDDAGNILIGTSNTYGRFYVQNDVVDQTGLLIKHAPASTSTASVGNISADNSNATATNGVLRVHHEDPPADVKMIQVDTTASNTVKFSVDEDGDGYFAGSLGIGTTSADYQLELEQAGGGFLSFKTTDTELQNNDVLGTIQFGADDATASGIDIGAKIVATATDNFQTASSNTDAPTRLDFFTQDNTSTDVMSTVGATLSLGGDSQDAIFRGNVGIGMTPASSVNLDINMSTNARGSFMDSIGEIGSGVFALQTTNEAGDALKPMGIRAEDIRLVTGSAIRLKLDDDSRISLSNNDSGTSNTVFGYQAGNQIGSGDNYNVFIGHQVADADMTDAIQNVGIGYQALTSLTGGESNTAIGSGSLYSLNTGNKNVAIGHLSADAITSAQYSVAIGYNALSAEVTQGTTVAIGYGALEDQNDSDGANSENVGIGFLAGAENVTGTSNTSVGFEAMKGAAGTSNSNNTGIGAKSMQDINAGANNVAVGSNAMLNATSSNDSVAIGYNAIGLGVLTGASNTVVGSYAGYDLTSATNNCFYGKDAGGNLTVGSNNVAIGFGAFVTVNAGEAANVAIGYSAMGSVDETINSGTGVHSADNNVAIGYNALLGGALGGGDVSDDTTRRLNHNVAIGYGALDATGTNASVGQIAIGYNSLGALTTGSKNTVIGYSAGEDFNGSNSVIIGYEAGLNADTSGSVATNSTLIGMEAGKELDDGTYNVAIGEGALRSNSGGGNTAIRNTAIGWQAADSLRTGSDNVIIGHGAEVSATNAVNQVAIGREATGTGDNEIALGNTSVSAIKAQVTSITAYSSDERTKKDIQDYNLKGLDFIKDLQLKTYIYKNPADFPDEIRSSRWDEEDVEKPADPTETQVGLIAQEVEEALKKHGIGNVETYAPTQDSGIKTLTYGNLIFPLIKAVQELSAKVTELENK